MNRQTWNWCEMDIAGYPYFYKSRNTYPLAIFRKEDKRVLWHYHFCLNDFSDKKIRCMKTDCPECWSLNYPAKRLVGLQIVDWPDEKTLCVEEPKTKLDTYVIKHIRRFLNPQGEKYDKQNTR